MLAESAGSRGGPLEYTPAGVDSRNARERDHFDQLAAEIGAVWWGSVTPAGQRRLAERGTITIRNAVLEPGKVVLEPGAGNGEFTLRIARSGATIIGIEISPKQLEIARDRLRDFPQTTVVEGDVDRLDYPDDYFDAIVGQSVLHHLDLDRSLPELYRVLKPAGRFFFLEPNMLNPQVAVEKKFKPIGRRLQNSPDETAFFRWRIVAILQRHGFRNARARPFDFLHPGTPAALIPAVHALSRALSATPVVREIAGSLQIYAEK
jgi:ubiquinone/menaquinone biosynthesis C-methylase UbiE